MSPQTPTATVKMQPEYPVRVLVDGTDLSASVTAVHIQTRGTHPSIVELGMGMVEFDGDRPTWARPDEQTRITLERMGWIPPDGHDLVTEDGDE